MPQPPQPQPLKNEDGSWSHPALPGISFRLKREAQAAADAISSDPLLNDARASVALDGETRSYPDPPAPAETLTYIPRF